MINFKERNSFSKMLLLFFLPIFLVTCTGCLVKTYSVVKDRPDQEMEGNQGFLMGGSSQKKATQQRKRKTYVTEIEFGRQKTDQKNTTFQQQLVADDYYVLEEAPIVLEPSSSKAQDESIREFSRYVVKKGDTLEKIAARPEVYNNKNRWYAIYKANKDTIKNPDRIKPGQVLKIPR